MVQTIDQLAREIDLMIYPDKCVILVFDGKKILKNHWIELIDGCTKSISEGATKFLGATIATSRQSTASTAKKQLEEKISLALKSIDSRPIRGELKSLDFPKLCGTIVQIPPDSGPYFRQWHQIHPEHCHEVL